MKACTEQLTPPGVQLGTLRTREHLNESARNRLSRSPGQRADTSHQALPINRADLIQNDLASLTLKRHCQARRIVSLRGGHGCDDHRAQMPVHFIRGDHGAGTSFPDFRSLRGIERHKPDFIPLHVMGHHRQPFLSKSFGNRSSISSSSSGSAATARKACSQPCLGE